MNDDDGDDVGHINVDEDCDDDVDDSGKGPGV